jgi:tetratricopeptide (TPR) repeat protein
VGDLEAAVGCWERVRELDPENGPARDYLDSVSEELGGGGSDVETLLEQGLAKYRVGDLEEAWGLLNRALSESPKRLDLLGYVALVKEQLLERYGEEIGDLDQEVRLAVPLDQLLERRLRPDQAYLLSRIDGAVSLDDLLSLCTGDRFEALQSVAHLLQQNLLVVA